MSKSNNISTNRTAIDDIAILRADELDAITGGADVQTEHTILSALSNAINYVVKSSEDARTSAARAG
jgi:hypothetical protein